MLSKLFWGQKEVEAEGFHRGTQEYPEGEVLIDPSRDGLEADFDRRMEEAEQASADRIKGLEARVETLERETGEAGEVRERMERLTKVAPPFMLALAGIVAAVFGVVGEAMYLAPVLQGQGIEDPPEQLFVALVIVVTAAILVKMTIHRLFPPAELKLSDEGAGAEDSRRHLRGWLGAGATAAMAIFTIGMLGMLGLWRAEELIFSASVSEGESSALGRFLGENPTLTKICVVLLTVALPIAAALALDWGLRQLHFAWQWRRARRIHLRRGRQLDKAEKGLEAEREKLAKRKEALARRRDEWVKALEEQYELGRRIRARRLPLWRVILKIAMAAALIFALCALAMPFLAEWVVDEGMQWAILLTVWLGVSLGYAVKALHAWERPNPRQLFRQQAVLWRDEALQPVALPTTAAPGDTRMIRAVESTALPAVEERSRLNGAA